MKSNAFEWEAMVVAPTRVGAVRNLFRTPTMLLRELECHVTTLNPGESPHPPHQHRAEEMLILKEGILEARLVDTVTRIGAGSVLFVASNELHGWTNVGDAPATYHVIQWKTDADE
jgi:quercetin dioxygenase-like cupin family protein